MKYYSVAEITVTDRGWVRDYVTHVTRLVERYGGRYLARTPHFEKTEGARPTGQIFLIIEWPSYEAASLFYDGDEYRPYRELRTAGARTEAVLVAGEDVNQATTLIEEDYHRGPKSFVDRVAGYYDANTRRFLRVAESPSSGAIHRGVWKPGVANAAEAADTVNRLVIERLRDHMPTGGGKVIDLGCGVGATMARIAQEIDASVSGVTISRVQAEIAAKRFAAAGLTERCQAINADFAELPEQPHYDAMVAIEAVVHSPSLETLILSLAERLQPRGRLVLCDDWMTDKDRGLAAREHCIAQFRAGWRIGSLHTVAELTAMAEGAGLRLLENVDLTPYLRLGRPRDHVIDLVVGATGAVPGLHDRLLEKPFWANMIGGSALQTGLSRRWLEYRLVVLERA